MQVIQTIRDKGAAVVIGVIALSLIGFLLMDAKSGNAKLFGTLSPNIGKINGESISKKAFDEKLQEVEKQQEARQQGKKPNANELRQQVWDQYIYESIINQQSQKLGIDFTPKELESLLYSDDPQNPLTQDQRYKDSITQKINRNAVSQFIIDFKKTKGLTPERKLEIKGINDYFNSFATQMKAQKLTTLLNASAYYAKWMQDKDAKETQTFANISYVQVPYGLVTDSAVGEIKDAEVEAYVNKNKSKFKQEAGRQISFVSFSTLPTSADTAQVLETLNKLKPLFAIDTNAKMFVGKNSSTVQFYDGYVSKNQMKMAAKDSITGAGLNKVYGPYLDGGNYVLSKIVSTKIMPDSIKCRHILLGTYDPQTRQPLMEDSVAHKIADSVANAIKSGGDFVALSNKFSTDKVAKKDKGVMTFDLTTIQSNQFAKEFADFLLNEKGETKKVVKTQFGWHYIELLEKKNPSTAYQIAYLARQIAAGENSIAIAQRGATQLAAQCRTVKELDVYTAKNGLQKITVPTVLKENDFRFVEPNQYMQQQEVPDARQIIRWAYSAKEGEVSSETYTYGDDIIVPIVEKVFKEGTKSAKDARPMAEAEIRRMKKAEAITKKIGTTLESAAAAYPNLAIAQAGADSSITYAAGKINNLGPEQKLVGAIFSKDAQTKVNIVPGNAAVYAVKVNGYAQKAALTPEQDAAAKKQKEASLRQQSALSGWLDQLKKQATIKDYRSESN